MPGPVLAAWLGVDVLSHSQRHMLDAHRCYQSGLQQCNRPRHGMLLCSALLTWPAGLTAKVSRLLSEMPAM